MKALDVVFSIISSLMDMSVEQECLFIHLSLPFLSPPSLLPHLSLQAGKYKNLKDIQEDLIIMVKNAHHFNVPGSEIFKKASVLRKFFVHRCSELEKKFQTVTATTDVAMKSCLEVADEVDSGEKKTPKLKISFCEKEKGCRQRSNVSSLSDLEEEAAM